MASLYPTIVLSTIRVGANGNPSSSAACALAGEATVDGGANGTPTGEVVDDAGVGGGAGADVKGAAGLGASKDPLPFSCVGSVGAGLDMAATTDAGATCARP